MQTNYTLKYRSRNWILGCFVILASGVRVTYRPYRNRRSKRHPRNVRLSLTWSTCLYVLSLIMLRLKTTTWGILSIAYKRHKISTRSKPDSRPSLVVIKVRTITNTNSSWPNWHLPRVVLISIYSLRDSD